MGILDKPQTTYELVQFDNRKFGVRECIGDRKGGFVDLTSPRYTWYSNKDCVGSKRKAKAVLKMKQRDQPLVVSEVVSGVVKDKKKKKIREKVTTNNIWD